VTGAPMPDVVVLLPGITGSVLAKDGNEVWSPSPGAVLRGLLSFGRTLRSLEVADDDPEAPDLGDGVTATRLVGAAHIIPGLWKVDVYDGLERYLLDNFELTPGRNYFAFPYDWRRDNRASARHLERCAHSWLSDWRASSGNSDAQLVLVAHSMGGLVSRYYVEALGHWPEVRRVVTFGTPFYGSMNAVDFLVHGQKKGLGAFSVDLTDLLRSMTSVHQLVPSYRCVCAADSAEATTPADAGLPGWRSTWDTPLLDFQRECDEAARANRADPAFETNPVVYQPITGLDQPTLQSVRLDDTGVAVAYDRGGTDEGGDGTVPLLSAALSGTQTSRTFVPERHARLHLEPGMQHHLGGVLETLHLPGVESLRDSRDGATAWFSLDVDDVFLADEPVSVRLQALSGQDADALPTVDATVTVRDESTGQVVVQRDVPVPRQRVEVELGVLPASTYVVEVAGRGARTRPVSDIFATAAPAEER
jgi:pimeloyl-ACP methyl ester carboxylesterase